MYTDINDHTLNEWIQAIAMHEQAALEKLYRATSPYVFALLKRMLHADSLAEEALQDVFFKVWDKADSYNSGKRSPLAWIVSIARHHAIEELRNRSSEEDAKIRMNNTSPDKLPIPNASETPQSEQTPELNFCLENINTAARECLIRAYCEGYSYDELSREKQRPVNTIKDNLRQGLLDLKECLDEQ